MKPIYETRYPYGDVMALCSSHRTLAAAKRAAKACERRGGAKHEIVKVVAVWPIKWPRSEPPTNEDI